jgi:hypothetical protein
LSIIEIPSSVTIIADRSFEGCTEHESCLITQNSKLVTIGAEAFANCTSLRSFDIPPAVGEIGSNCFSECIYLYRLKFWTSESLKRVFGELSVDEVLEGIGLITTSSLLRIDVEDGGEELQFPGWSSVGREGDSELSLVTDHQ